MSMKHAIYATVATNNDPPSNGIVNSAREDMSVRLKDLSRVQPDLEKLRKELGRLEEEEKSIRQDLDMYNRILSPIRRLPFDILGEIFLHCLSEDKLRPPTLTDISQAPLLLMQVCRTWRYTTLAYPRLWASLRLEIVDAKTTPSQTGALRRQIQEWLSRSGACPIYLVMSSTCRGIAGYAQNRNQSVVQALLPFMHRCGSLYLLGEHQPFIELLAPEALVALRFVRIEPIKGGYSARTWQPLANLMAAPNLRAFYCLASSSSDISITDIPLHLSPHLTRLVLDGLRTPYEDVLAALRLLADLRFLQIKFARQSLPNATVTPKVSLPRLEELLIREWIDLSETATFLNCLTDMSSLTSLEFRASVDPVLYQTIQEIGFPFAAHTMLTKNIEPKNLLHLSIPLSLNRDQVLECLRALPYITQLDLISRANAWRKDVELFDLEDLVVQQDMPVLLPRLLHLTILNSQKTTDETVLRFIISRIQALPFSDTSNRRVAVLASFEGLFLRGKQQDIMYAVKQYAIDAGIKKVPDIELTYEPSSH